MMDPARIARFSRGDWLVLFGAPALFILIVFLFHPFREVFQFDPDEGLELITAQLILDGQVTPDEIWNDQPPLVNYLLAVCFWILGESVNVGRTLILVMSGVMMGASGAITQVIGGRAARNLVFIVLFMVPWFLQLSVSVMIGMPSIAFAMLALTGIVFWEVQGWRGWLLFAGVMMGLSISAKAFTGFLPLVFALGLTISAWLRMSHPLEWRNARFWWALLAPAMNFVLPLIFTVLLFLVVLIPPVNWMPLVTTHLEARLQNLTPPGETPTILLLLKPILPLFLLAGVGLVNGLVSKRWLVLYPTGWMLSAFFVLLNHAPVWYHHQLLVTIPAAILAAIGIGLPWQALWAQRGAAPAAGIGLVLSAALLGWICFIRVPPVLNALSRPPSFSPYGLDPDSGEMQVLTEMQRYVEDGDILVTDLPMYAFRARLTVPPELAVVTSKRVWTGNLTDADFIAAVERDKPPAVVLARFPLVDVGPYLWENGYERALIVMQKNGRSARLFVRTELLNGE